VPLDDAGGTPDRASEAPSWFMGLADGYQGATPRPSSAGITSRGGGRMDPAVWILIIVVVILVVGLVGWGVSRQRRSQQLRQQFGPEYERTVDQAGDRKAGEQELQQRRERREQLKIRELEPDARDRYAESWRAAQARFVDAPEQAVGEADALLKQVMHARGYPVEDFEQRASDISVDHPKLVENYRAAHAVSLAAARGQANTEDLRQALVYYRELFEDLLGGERQVRADREAP
jgi:hypothetical protein